MGWSLHVPLSGHADRQGYRFLDEARSRSAGVPDSEPTWIRPLDGTLAALALQELGADDCVARWRWIFRTRFAFRHGRRPAALHTPSMLSITACWVRDWYLRTFRLPRTFPPPLYQLDAW
jgi:hypothetical protein